MSTLWVGNEERAENIKRRIKAAALQHGDDPQHTGVIVVRKMDADMMRLVAINVIGQPEIDGAILFMPPAGPSAWLVAAPGGAPN